MESIVSPWMIYLLGILGNVNIVLGASFMFFCIAMVVCGIIAIVAISCGEGDDVTRFLSKVKLIHYFVVGIFLIICIFVPNRETVIGMYVANEITYDRADKAMEIGKDIKDSIKKDVIDIIQEITREQDGEQ